MKNILILLFLFVTISCFSVDYWSDYLHKTDVNNFDKPAMMYGQISELEAKQKDSYTITDLDKSGNIIEAVSLLNNKPNYYYTYLYENNKIKYRSLSFFKDTNGNSQLLSEVFYEYNSGNLINTSYITYDYFGVKKIKFTKEYSGSTYRVFDYSEPDEDYLQNSNMRTLITEVKELQKLEKRNLIKKVFGIR